MSKPTHSHLCPSCFEYVPCDMDCTVYEYDDPISNLVLPTAHPVLCDECLKSEPSRMLEIGLDPIAMGM